MTYGVSFIKLKKKSKFNGKFRKVDVLKEPIHTQKTFVHQILGFIFLSRGIYIKMKFGLKRFTYTLQKSVS